MQRNTTIPPLATLKDQARRLRADLTARGHDTTHAQALEMLAHQMGLRDWNTLAALAGRTNAPTPLTLGARITGRYLGHDVAGTVLAIAAHGGLTRLTIKLDEPVDVVRFDSFSSLRRRITVSLNDDGETPQRTSDGQPHFVRMAA
ncbi:glyoxalase superfamily protein [Octadecabacter sp. R77987]|uniref:glyoxalase superfamily protein n=1 Tax=Octadecabacter sp. R77987 TaxID=3093874 RepID=UPI00366C3B9F